MFRVVGAVRLPSCMPPCCLLGHVSHMSTAPSGKTSSDALSTPHAMCGCERQPRRALRCVRRLASQPTAHAPVDTLNRLALSHSHSTIHNARAHDASYLRLENARACTHDLYTHHRTHACTARMHCVTAVSDSCDRLEQDGLVAHDLLRDERPRVRKRNLKLRGHCRHACAQFCEQRPQESEQL